MDPNQTPSSLPAMPTQPIAETPVSVVTSPQPSSTPSPESVLRDIVSLKAAPKSPEPKQTVGTAPSLSETPELPKAPGKLLSAPAHHTSWGALAGILIILIVLIIGGLYFWGAELSKEDSSLFTPDAPADTSDATDTAPDTGSAQ